MLFNGFSELEDGGLVAIFATGPRCYRLCLCPLLAEGRQEASAKETYCHPAAVYFRTLVKERILSWSAGPLSSRRLGEEFAGKLFTETPDASPKH